MSNNNNEKRRRPNLYKKTDGDKKDEDVLKQLKKVRQNLQDSLSDDIPAGGPKPIRKRGDRRLYKKEEDKVPSKKGPIKPTKKKTAPAKSQVSKKRLAAVQRRVKAKIESTKTLTKKKKAVIVIFMVLFTVPLFFLSTIALATIELDFTGFGLSYNEYKPGTITVTLPARNPSFLASHLDPFTIEIHSGNGTYIGKAYTDAAMTIEPFQTQTIAVTLTLDPLKGGIWLADILTDLKLSINLGKVTYSGISIDASFVPTLELDIQPLIRDAITGFLDLESLISGLELEEMLGVSSPVKMSDDGQKMIIDPYTNAKKNTLIPRLSQIAGMDDMTMNISFDMTENNASFNFGLGAKLGIYDLISYEDLGGIQLGPIRFSNLDVELMVSTTKQYTTSQLIKKDDTWHTHYTTPIAKVISTMKNEIYIADKNMRDSILGINMTINKDDPTLLIGGQHPSAWIKWDADPSDANSTTNFLAGTGAFTSLGGPAWQKLPGWFFIYNILGPGGLDCGLKLNNIDLEIFGLNITGVSIPMSVLPPFKLDAGVLSPENLLRVAPDYGILGVLKHFTKGITEGPARALLGIPPGPASGPKGSVLPPERDLDTIMTDMMGMIEFPEITFDSIEETWGPGAKLHIGLPISINNTEFNFHMGFSNMTVGIASTINDISKDFLTIKLTGNDSDLVYLDGLNSYTTVNVEVDIFKDEEHAPFAVKFLSTLLENFTIDGIIKASFARLLLFEENYTFGNFEVAIPLVMDMESILIGLIEEMVPGLVNGLIDLGDENSSQTSMLPFTPLALLTGFNPLPSLFSVLQEAPTLQQYVAQDEGEGETTDMLNDLINDLINSLINSLAGGFLGSEMEFTLGLDVEVQQGQYVKFTVSLTDFYIEEFFISIGLGKTDLRLQSKGYDGQWHDMVGIQVDDYFEIKGGKQEDIAITLTIYEGSTLCRFIDDFMTEFFNESATNTLDLRVLGQLTLNLSGLYLPELDLELALEDMDTGLNGTAIIGDVVDMIYDLDLELGDNSGAPGLLDIWAGPLTQIPFISQGLDIESLFHLGEISLAEISETKFGDSQDGEGLVKLSIDVINYMMSINIDFLDITLYDQHPVDGSDPTKLLTISIDDGYGIGYGLAGQINVSIIIHKGDKTANYLNTLIKTIKLDGWVNFSAKVNVFGCDIELKPTYIPAINLSRVPIDITTLLGMINPFTAPFMGLMGPRVAQDINIDSIFENAVQFAIGAIKIGEYTDNPVPLDYDNPFLGVDLDLWLNTMFNMTINKIDLSLMDGDIYKALHVDGGHAFEAAKREAEIATIQLLDAPVYLNNCYIGNLDQNGIPTTSGLPTRDPNKPYLINTTSCVRDSGNDNKTYECDVGFETNYFQLEDYWNRTFGEGVNKTAFNETGFTDTNYMVMKDGALNNFSMRIGMLNKSHGTWGTKYPRQYWKNLGGPYFPVQKYSGFPDHRYIYPQYYSPIVSLIDKALGLLTEEGIGSDSDAISELINGIAVGGTVEITMFSMNLTIDLNSNALNSLFEPISSMFLVATGMALKEVVRQTSTPFQSSQHPDEQLISKMVASEGIADIFGDLLDMSSLPLDINEILGGISFPGIADKTNHFYSTQTLGQDDNSRCWDGTMKWDKRTEYLYDPEDMTGYIGGLDDPYFTGEAHSQYAFHPQPFEPKETFYKDFGYDWFKTVCDNWANSMDKYNPYFETNHTLNGHYMKGEGIEDPADWPLLYNRGVFGGRCRTNVLTLHTGLLLNFPVGILSGRLSIWLENPYVPCEYMPMGYVFINNSVMLKSIKQILDDQYVIDHLDDFLPLPGEDYDYYDYDLIKSNFETHGHLVNESDLGDQTALDTVIMAFVCLGVNGSRAEGGYQIDQYGNMKSPGWVVNFNIRFFEGLGSYEFFWQMIQGGSFNIHFLAQGEMNVSLFGYEFYNLFIPPDIAALGDPSSFQSKCDQWLSQQGGGGYGHWGVPATNGTVEDELLTVTHYTDWWPHYLLKGDTLEFAVSLPIDAILNFEDLLDLGELLGDTGGLLDGLGLSGGGLTLDLDIDIENPVPLVLFIESVYIRLVLAGSASACYNPDAYAIEIVSMQNIPLIDLSNAGYGGYDEQDPYDLRYNSYQDWHTPHPVTLAIRAIIPLTLGDLLNIVIPLVSTGFWALVTDLEINVIIPNGLGYRYELVIDIGDFSDPMPMDPLL